MAIPRETGMGQTNMGRLQSDQSTRRGFVHTARLVAFLALVVSHVGLAQESDSRSYILLDHGGILHGAARPVGDKIEIQLSEGNSIRVDAKNIAHIGATKEGIYAFQSRSIRNWGLNEHWHMTQWCAQNDLIEQALYHFKEVEKLSEPSSKRKQLENQVKFAILRSEPVKKYLAEQQTSSSSESDVMSQSDPSQNQDRNVKLASAIMPMESGAEIKAGSVPSYVRKSFQQSITPILVSKCGQAGCHGLPGKSSFHIYQPVGDQAAETAVQNLLNVLKYVNPKKPNESPLLAYATNPHGIQKHPSLNPLKESDHTTIVRIEQWIKSLDSTAPPQVTTAVAQTPAGPVSPAFPGHQLIDVPETKPGDDSPPASRKEMLLSLRNEMGERDPSAKLSKPTKQSSGPIALSDGEISGLEKAIERLEKQQTVKGKKDPFDPNEFNTRFGSKK
jgi:hypothetical protein